MHVARPRLIRRLSDAPVVLIEAGGGYGKSTLAAEFRRTLGIASAEAVLERGVSGADELIGVLRRGLRRAGLTDAAAVLTAAGVADERPLLLVVDEVQRASGEAVGLRVGVRARCARPIWSWRGTSSASSDATISLTCATGT